MYKVGRLRMCSVLAVSLAAQVWAAPHLAIFGVKPDFVTISILIFGFLGGSSAGFEAGLIGGFLQDMFALDLFGVNAFLGALAGFIAGSVGTQFNKESNGVRVMVITLSAIAAMVLRYTASAFLSPYHALGFGEYIFTAVVPGAIATAFFSGVALSRFLGVFTAKRQDDFL